MRLDPRCLLSAGSYHMVPAGLLAQHGLLDFAWNDFLMDRLVRL